MLNIKNLKCYILPAISVAIICSFTIIKDWYLFETSFLSIEFPNKPTLNSQKVASNVGVLNLETAFYEPTKETKDAYLYGAMTSVYPDSLISSDKVEILSTFFRSSIDGTLKDINGKLLAEKVINYKQYPGREIKVDYGNGQAIVYMRLYLVKNVATILQVITPTITTDSTSRLRFFNSFRLK